MMEYIRNITSIDDGHNISEMTSTDIYNILAHNNIFIKDICDLKYIMTYNCHKSSIQTLYIYHDHNKYYIRTEYREDNCSSISVILSQHVFKDSSCRNTYEQILEILKPILLSDPKDKMNIIRNRFTDIHIVF